VDDWAAPVNADLYVRAMGLGESFFVAIGNAEGWPSVLGFSTHKIVGAQHRTAVYVRGRVVRTGVGSALFKRAEADAIESGAGAIDVDASLAASDFYRANGFHEVGRGEHQLWSGRRMACIFMRKHLSTPNRGV